jgi:hypothetical protein
VSLGCAVTPTPQATSHLGGSGTSRRLAFAAFLRAGREARGLAVSDVARTTRIPERSLALLEAGAFDALPAEVFVRGFLRAYAVCVGLDPEATVRRWADDCRGPEQPRSAWSLRRARPDRPRPGSEPAWLGAAPGAPAGCEDDPTAAALREAAPGDDDEGDSRPAGDGEDRGPHAAGSLAARTAGSAADRQGRRSLAHATGRFIARSLFDRDDRAEGSRRGAVTLAVIILVIVATLAMSYLLRRPSSGGDGMTRAPAAPELTELTARQES